MKEYTKCHKKKCLVEFNVGLKSPDGRQPRCIECMHKYYVEHRQHKLAYRKEYAEKNKEKISNYMTNYLATHVEESKLRKRRYYKDNRERLQQYQADLYKKYGAVGDRRTLIKLGKPAICELCNKKSSWKDNKIHIHHRDRNPKNHSLENLGILCAKCHENLHKNWEASILSRKFTFNLLSKPNEGIRLRRGWVHSQSSR